MIIEGLLTANLIRLFFLGGVVRIIGIIKVVLFLLIVISIGLTFLSLHILFLRAMQSLLMIIVRLLGSIILPIVCIREAALELHPKTFLQVLLILQIDITVEEKFVLVDGFANGEKVRLVEEEVRGLGVIVGKEIPIAEHLLKAVVEQILLIQYQD